MSSLNFSIHGVGLYGVYASLIWATSPRLLSLSWVMGLMLIGWHVFSLHQSQYLDVTLSSIVHAFPLAAFVILLVNTFLPRSVESRSRLIILAVLMVFVFPATAWLHDVLGFKWSFASPIESLAVGTGILLTCAIIWSKSKNGWWLFVGMLFLPPLAMFVGAGFLDLDNAAMGYAFLMFGLLVPVIFYFLLTLTASILSKRLQHTGRTVLLFCAFTIASFTNVGPVLPYFSLVEMSAENREKEEVRNAKQALHAQGPACRYESLHILENAVVYAAGGKHNNKLDFQIDQSGDDARLYTVVVNSPSAPVALLLGAYNASVWDIKRTEGTEIIAVMASGYEGQVVSGIDSSVPVLISTIDNNGKCAYFRFDQKSEFKRRGLSKRLFGLDITGEFWSDASGTVTVGAPIKDNIELLSSSINTVDSYRNSDTPLAGQRGIDEAIREGILRPATKDDVERWVQAQADDKTSKVLNRIKNREPTPKPFMHGKSYVVLKEFFFPAGLHGARPAVFIVEKGVPMPTGDRGHSSVFDFDTLSCVGC